MPHEKKDDFSKLVEQHQASVMRICYIYLRDITLAEDAAQETFLKAYKAMSRFRGESTKKTWLIQIAINTCKDINRCAWNRKNNRYITPEMLPLAYDPFEKEDEILLVAIMNLPDKQREAILLYFYQDLGLKEVSEIIGISVPTVSKRIQKGVKMLYSSLKGGNLDE